MYQCIYIYMHPPYISIQYMYVMYVTHNTYIKGVFFLVGFFLFVCFLAASCSLWDLSSLTRD